MDAHRHMAAEQAAHANGRATHILASHSHVVIPPRVVPYLCEWCQIGSTIHNLQCSWPICITHGERAACTASQHATQRQTKQCDTWCVATGQLTIVDIPPAHHTHTSPCERPRSHRTCTWHAHDPYTAAHTSTGATCSVPYTRHVTSLRTPDEWKLLIAILMCT